MIDELLNIELYRRDYKFNNPIFPEEVDAGEEFDGEVQDDPNLHGTQELNGIAITTEGDKKDLITYDERSIMSPATKLRRGVSIQGKIEETKINFFNPQKYEE